MKTVAVRADAARDREDRKAFVTEGLESGMSVFILRKGDEGFESIGRFEAIYFEDGQPVDDRVAYCTIDTPEDQERALSLAGRKDTVIVKAGDWTVIPLENMIARFRSSGTRVFAEASTREDAELYLRTMENGVDGIVVSVDDPSEVSAFKGLCVEEEDSVLTEVTVTGIRQTEMSDRVCVDTCSMMVPGEGMLVGSYSNCLFLVQSESEENGYVASRPFRVNASAVHAYIKVPGGMTRYLSEISSGDSVVVCDRSGKSRAVSVGRCKNELRPMLMVDAELNGRRYSIVLQNAETVKLVTRDGAVSVTALKPGDRVLAEVTEGGRHFGMAVEETITEK